MRINGNKVVGTKYHNSTVVSMAWRAVETGADVSALFELVREVDNEHDENAVRVDFLGQTLGHLARFDAASLVRVARQRFGTAPVIAAVRIDFNTGILVIDVTLG